MGGDDFNKSIENEINAFNRRIANEAREFLINSNRYQNHLSSILYYLQDKQTRD